MSGFTSHRRSTALGVVVGVLAGVVIAGFLVLDPLGLHGLAYELSPARKGMNLQ